MKTKSDKNNKPSRIICKRIRTLENFVLCRLWSRILVQFNKTSIYLQPSSMRLGNATKLLSSLDHFIGTLRNSFEGTEETADTVMLNSVCERQSRKREANLDSAYQYRCLLRRKQKVSG
jgi:hypothetical protein